MLERLIRDTDAIGRLTGDVLLLVDTAGVILHATPEAEILFGMTPDQLTGLPFGIPISSADGTEVVMSGTGRQAHLRQENIQEGGLNLIRILLRDVTRLSQSRGRPGRRPGGGQGRGQGQKPFSGQHHP